MSPTTLSNKYFITVVIFTIISLGGLLFGFTERARATKASIRIMELQVEVAEAIRAQESAIQEAFKQRELAIEAQRLAEDCAQESN